jgi:hypothetical protein
MGSATSNIESLHEDHLRHPYRNSSGDRPLAVR